MQHKQIDCGGQLCRSGLAIDSGLAREGKQGAASKGVATSLPGSPSCAPEPLVDLRANPGPDVWRPLPKRDCLLALFLGYDADLLTAHKLCEDCNSHFTWFLLCCLPLHGGTRQPSRGRWRDQSKVYVLCLSIQLCLVGMRG